MIGPVRVMIGAIGTVVPGAPPDGPTVGGVNSWTWRYESVDGSPFEGAQLPRGSFPSQADAETWIGEVWKDLLAAGVEQVSLLDGGRQVYGPMSLRPVE